MPSSWDANKNSTQREGVPRGNWIQTDPKKGFLCDPAPLQSARAILHQGMAAKRDRVGPVAHDTAKNAYSAHGTSATLKPRGAMSVSDPFSDVNAKPAHVAE